MGRKWVLIFASLTNVLANHLGSLHRLRNRNSWVASRSRYRSNLESSRYAIPYPLCTEHVEGIRFLCRPAANYPNPSMIPVIERRLSRGNERHERSRARERARAAEMKKIRYKAQPCAADEEIEIPRHGAEQQRSSLPASSGADTISRLRGEPPPPPPPFTYDLAVAIEDTRQHTHPEIARFHG